MQALAHPTSRLSSRTALAMWSILVASLFIHLPIFQSEDSGNTLSLYHVLLLVPLAAAVPKVREAVMTVEVAFFVTLIATSALAWLVFGWSVRSILVAFALAAFIGGRWFVACTDEFDRETVFKWLVVAIVLATVVRNTLFHDRLALVYGRSASQEVWFLATGGPNLESSFLAMAAALMSRTRWFLPMASMAGLTSVLMLSRAGIIATALAFAFWIVIHRHSVIRSVVLLVGLTAATSYGFVLASSGIQDDVAKRFDLSVEQDLASENLGRLAIWRSAAERIIDHPLGHGAGNGYALMNAELGDVYRENNCHNILLDLTLDGGLQTMLLASLIFFRNGVFAIRTGHPIAQTATIYAVLGMVQFLGYDTIGWFFIGASSGLRIRPETAWRMNPKSSSSDREPTGATASRSANDYFDCLVPADVPDGDSEATDLKTLAVLDDRYFDAA